ncbi:MAG: hypothetical protein GJT30_13730 [Geobacter sp.]|nr:hypothetical protein [Geobacter sp.]
MFKLMDLFVEFLIKPFFSEKIRVIKYYDQKQTAARLLASGNPGRMKKGLSLLFELALSYPYRVQEVINDITTFLRDTFPQDRQPIPGHTDILESGLRSLVAMPRVDQNGFPYNFDIHQIRIEGIDGTLDLTRMNFRHFSLWGCRFINVILSHSSFEEADLGGTVFDQCSLEYANLKGAKMCGSFMDQGRPTLVRNTRLWGTNLNEADIEFCELHNFDNIDLSGLEGRITDGKLRIIGAH